ncbi:MAG: 16S rRNA (guanine(966)-N(2))-methyltransferase RsmD [bacterium]|nr:16S rRNA (guanine(966)-N(2))-methyltransferase RsmD [bacterium]
MSRGASNLLRIVGGKWRSRRIRFVDAEGLRPTPDRVRETLFNWLQFEINGARCLDAFAGSGALGFEALSRGAAQVVMLEKQRAQFLALQTAAQELQATDAVLIAGDALSLLKIPAAWQPADGFDGVFLDPPFHQSLLPEICTVLQTRSLLKPDAFVYIESESEWPALALPSVFVVQKTARAGLVHAYLARYQPDAVSPAGAP